MTDQPRSPSIITALLLVLCIIFFLSGLAIIPYVGIQTDEAIFSEVLFDGARPWFVVSIFKKKVAFMVMSYLGTLKSGLYWAIWHVADPSAFSLRIPTLLIGVASLICFYRFLCRATNLRTATFATALLATDSSYIMTTTFDWGPVAIQHLCLVAGLLLLLKSFQTSHLAPLAGGSLALGLGLWDKALFAWMLSGAVVAAICIFPQEIKRFFTLRRIMVAGFFFLLGALPLVIYNFRRPLETFRGNARFSSEDLIAKLYLMRGAIEGSTLFGYIIEEDWPVKQREPSISMERVSIGLSKLAGERRRNLNWYAFAASLAGLPFLLFGRFRRPALFCLLTMVVAWGQMLATKGAGGGTHHAILLWPFPVMLISISAAALASRLGRFEVPFLTTVAVVLCSAAMLVNNHYLAQAIRNGGAGAWSTAHYNLVTQIRRYSADKIFLTDWGMLDNTRMLLRGVPPLEMATEPLMNPEPSRANYDSIRYVLRHPNAIFVSNTDARQVFPEVNARLRRITSELGYERELLDTVYDFNGRPSFEIFRFGKR